MLEKLRRLQDFLLNGLWREVTTPSRLLARGIHATRIVTLAVRGFLGDRCLLQATALAYVTLLSLIPLLAVAFSVAKGFGIQDQIKPLIDKWVAANQEEVGTQIVAFIERTSAYIRDTRVTAFGAIALLMLVWTTIKVLGTIEKSFNQIWGVKRSRTLFRKVTDYISMLVISPILLLAGMSAATALQSSPAARSVLANALLGRLVQFALVYVTTWIAFTALYLFMPNTRVKFLAALIGGITAGTVWQAAFLLYTSLQVGMAKYNAIYGTFAALPVFMIWLYLSWSIVLLGAEVSWASQSVKRYWEERRSASASFAAREAIALRTMVDLAVAFQADATPLTATELAERMKAPSRLVLDIMDVLLDAGICSEVVTRNASAYQPARPLDHITPAMVIAAIRNAGEPLELSGDGPLVHAVRELLAAAADVRKAGLEGQSLHDIASRLAPAEARVP